MLNLSTYDLSTIQKALEEYEENNAADLDEDEREGLEDLQARVAREIDGS